MSATTVVIAVEAVLLLLVVVFVVALLRSHAEILRRLHALEGGPSAEGGPLATGARPAAADPRPAGGPPPHPHPGAPPRPNEAPGHLVGQTLDGDSVKLALGAHSRTLLAFMSSGCAACGPLWAALREAAGIDARLVVVTHAPDRESVARLRELAPPECELVMSSHAWADFAVPGTPYFVLVDGGAVAGQGVAGSWAQLVDLVRQSSRDEADAPRPGSFERPGPDRVEPEQPRSASSGTRAARAEDALTRAGIAAGHPSLYPSRQGQGRTENGSET